MPLVKQRLPIFVSPSSDTGAFSHIFFSFMATGDSSDEATAKDKVVSAQKFSDFESPSVFF